MGFNREPCLQRRKKFNQSCSCGPPHQTFNEPVFDANLSKTPSVLPLAEPEAASGPLNAGGLSEKPMDPYGNPAIKDQFAMKSQNPSRSSPVPLNQRQSPTKNHSLHRKAGLGYREQQPSLHKTEYNVQFHPKKAPVAPSPILTAHKVLYSSHSTAPPFKKKHVTLDTEYQRSFQGLAPPPSPRLRKNHEHEQTPLFYTLVNGKDKNQLKKKPQTSLENKVNNKSQSSSKQGSHDLEPSNLRSRVLTEYESRFCIPLSNIPEEEEEDAMNTPQIKELREQALSYRRRAWGTNFSRAHLSQLLSEHNVLWEPTETIDSTSDCPQSTRLDLCQVSSVQPDSGRTSCIEALDLASNSGGSSKRSSTADSKDREMKQTSKNTKTNETPPQTSQSPLVGDHLLFEEHDKSDGDEEGRLPTPKLKMKRTHLDLTTPATGGAILVGKLKGTQTPGTADSVLANADTSVHIPVKPREAWSPDTPPHKPAPSPVSKLAPSQSSPLVSVLPITAPLHCIQGTLRHADFQHNGELGLRFKEQKCSRGGCGSSEDDRLSVMSWRSAASCSLASAVLKRAQKRRDKFWGKT